MTDGVFCGFQVFDCDDEFYNGISLLPDFRYEEIKGAAVALMEKCHIESAPVDVFALARMLGVHFVKYSMLTEHEKSGLEKCGISRDSDGFFALAEKNGSLAPYIYYNDAKSLKRIRFTILHEIGHYVLGHKGQSDLAEAEANFFAKYLIAPPMLVDLIQPSDYMDIEKIFDTSKQCAIYSFNFYEKWKRHHEQGGFVFARYEKTLLSLCAESVLRRKSELQLEKSGKQLQGGENYGF